MSLTKWSAALLATALIPALLPSVASAAPERRVYEKKATLTTSAPGYPDSSDPGHQLRRAHVVVRYYDSGSVAIDAAVSLKGTSQDARIVVGVGVLQGGQCNTDGRYLATRNTYHRDGTNYELWNSGLPSTTKWNCTTVVIHDRADSPNEPYDAMVGRLGNHYIQPKLALSAPRLLGKATKRLSLVRGASQAHSFVVRNTGKYRARNVVLTARGKGMKPVRKSVGRIDPGESAEVRVPLRLKSAAKRTKLRVTVSGSGVKASRVVKVRRVKAPPRPGAGAWRSGDSTFTFKVKKGKITKFRGIRLRMECRGGLGDYPTYRYINASFPAVKVPKHGYVEASKRWRKGSAWYSASLSGRVVGKKMTRATFSYATAGSCLVIEGFKARRR